MKLIQAFVCTALFGFLLSMATFATLIILYNDVLTEIFYKIILGLFLSIGTIGTHILLVFLPLFLYYKDRLEEKGAKKAYMHLIPAVILPSMIILATINYNFDNLITEPAAQVYYIHTLITVFASFWVFLRSLITNQKTADANETAPISADIRPADIAHDTNN